LGNKETKTDLVLLPLEDMDIILGMDWMTKHKKLLEIASRVLEIDSPYDGATTLLSVFYRLPTVGYTQGGKFW
jgi:hypothetical protein